MYEWSERLAIPLYLAGLQKTFGLPCLEAEILQATVDQDTLPTHVIASAKELNRFHTIAKLNHTSSS